jgi:peptidoglycan/xylan/chitin deacetylase (PgdA/CDA1 family)/glycosyltransferase involved in cell wall biosynthesis
MSDRRRIAAVITCHDLGRTLDEALASVERQTRPAAEIVVVDDDSDDVYTQQVVARIERAGTRVMRTGGRGASAARNAGAAATSAEYLIWLDADDVLEPEYFAAAAARLDEDPAIDFVSCGMRAFGAANYTWSPSALTFVDAISTGAVPHASTMIRRHAWEATGRFDESLRSFELLDFWATAVERGSRGLVLDEPLLNYRVRAGSAYRRSIETGTYRERLQHFYRKHHAALARQWPALVEGKEAFLLSQMEYRKTLEARAGALEAELADLRRQIDEATKALEARGLSRVEWGDFRRVQPLSPRWGLDRGQPIDRYYIERFLDRHRADIRGKVLEVRDARYTKQFGGSAVTASDVVDIDPTNDAATITADLRSAAAIAADSYDCIVLTQVLQFIDEIPAALAECYRILKPGGALLVTAPCVNRVDVEAGPDADYWRLTEASTRKYFAAIFPPDAFEVSTFGNVGACAAFLQGVSAGEMTPADLDPIDAAFPLLVGVRAVKPEAATAQAAAASRAARSLPTSHRAVILAYHRVAALQPDSHHLCTPPDVFRDQMQSIARDYSPVSLEELVEAAAAGRIPEHAVAITLDDGYLDALTAASPILAELGVPATFFVSSDRLSEEHERWWDVLERLPLPPSELDALNKAMWPLDADGRRQLVSGVLARNGCDTLPRSSHRVMTADEIRELANRPGHAIGSHTVHHLALTTQPLDTRRCEVTADKTALEQTIGQAVPMFSYPYGDYDAQLVSVVRDAGFRAAVTVDAGTVSAGSNRLLLPRYEVTVRDHDRFADWLREIFRTATTG